MGYYIIDDTPDEPDYQALVDKWHVLDQQSPEPIGDLIKELFDQLMAGDSDNVTGSEFDWGVENDDTL